MPENSNNKWTPEADARLKSLIEADRSAHFIAAELKRSVSAIRGPREHTAHTDETGTGRAEGNGKMKDVFSLVFRLEVDGRPTHSSEPPRRS